MSDLDRVWPCPLRAGLSLISQLLGFRPSTLEPKHQDGKLVPFNYTDTLCYDKDTTQDYQVWIQELGIGKSYHVMREG